MRATRPRGSRSGRSRLRLAPGLTDPDIDSEWRTQRVGADHRAANRGDHRLLGPVWRLNEEFVVDLEDEERARPGVGKGVAGAHHRPLDDVRGAALDDRVDG